MTDAKPVDPHPDLDPMDCRDGECPCREEPDMCGLRKGDDIRNVNARVCYLAHGHAGKCDYERAADAKARLAALEAVREAADALLVQVGTDAAYLPEAQALRAALERCR